MSTTIYGRAWFAAQSFHDAPERFGCNRAALGKAPSLTQPCPHCGAISTPDLYVGVVDRLHDGRWVSVWSCCGTVAQ